MEGLIELYYDMPHLETYLKAAGANYDAEKLKMEIDVFIEQAVMYHIEKKKFIIMGTLNKYLESDNLFEGSRELFRKMPTISSDIFFETNPFTLSDCSDYLCEKEKMGVALWQATGKRGGQEIFRTTTDIIYEMQKSREEMLENTEGRPIIFLDFDGVLNTDRHYAELYDKGLPTEDSYGPLFDPESVKNLEHIINVTEAVIVVSSSWRYAGLEEMRRMWFKRYLPGYIKGITPMHIDDDKLLETDLETLDMITANQFCSSRGNEIKAYFEETGMDMDTQRYVIMDDLKDMLPEQENHSIRIDPIVGITEKDAERAIEILKLINSANESIS